MMRICLPVNHKICISVVIVVPETILMISIVTLSALWDIANFVSTFLSILWYKNPWWTNILGHEGLIIHLQLVIYLRLKLLILKESMISSNIAPQLAQFAVRQALFVAENIAIREKGEEMIGELTFSQRGHTIPLDDKILGLLSRLLATGRMCE